MTVARTASVAIVTWLAVTAAAAAQRPLPRAIRAVAQRAAGAYPLDSAFALGHDSLVFVFRDSSLTWDALTANTWTFGPATNAAEEDGCPPEKVLGRRIARSAWTAVGRPASTQVVIIRVHGPISGVHDTTVKMERVSTALYYPRIQLTGPWVGDSTADPTRRAP